MKDRTKNKVAIRPRTFLAIVVIGILVLARAL